MRLIVMAAVFSLFVFLAAGICAGEPAADGDKAGKTEVDAVTSASPDAVTGASTDSTTGASPNNADGNAGKKADLDEEIGDYDPLASD